MFAIFTQGSLETDPSAKLSTVSTCLSVPGRRCVRAALEIHHWLWEKHGKNHGKFIGKSWEIHGKNHGKIMGKSTTNCRPSSLGTSSNYVKPLQTMWFPEGKITFTKAMTMTIVINRSNRSTAGPTVLPSFYLSSHCQSEIPWSPAKNSIVSWLVDIPIEMSKSGKQPHKELENHHAING